MIHFDIMTLLFLLLFFGISAGLAHTVSILFENDERGVKQLPEGERIPALPVPRSGPYRKPGTPDECNDASGADEFEAAERFRRYVYCHERMLASVSEQKFRELANMLDSSHLADVLEDAESDTPRRAAAIHAFTMRDNPMDINVLLNLLFESEWTHVPEAVLYALRIRGPVSEEVISAVYDIVYAEEDEFEKHEEYEYLHRLAEDILDEWEERHPEVMKQFALLS